MGGRGPYIFSYWALHTLNSLDRLRSKVLHKHVFKALLGVFCAHLKLLEWQRDSVIELKRISFVRRATSNTVNRVATQCCKRIQAHSMACFELDQECLVQQLWLAKLSLKGLTAKLFLKFNTMSEAFFCGLAGKLRVDCGYLVEEVKHQLVAVLLLKHLAHESSSCAARLVGRLLFFGLAERLMQFGGHA